MINQRWLIIAGMLFLILLVLNRTGWIRLPTKAIRSVPVEFFTIFVFLGVAIPAASNGQIPIYWGVIAVGIGLLISGSTTVRDYVYGLSTRWEKRIKPGDTITFREHHGVVARLRRLHLVIDDGQGEVLVPYSSFVSEVVHRRSPMSGALPHRFDLTWAGSTSHEQIANVVRRVALLHPWGGGGREAVFEATGARKAQITVYTIEGGRGFEIERAIRDAVDVL